MTVSPAASATIFKLYTTPEIFALMARMAPPPTKVGADRCIRPRCVMQRRCGCTRIGEESWLDWAKSKVKGYQDLILDTATYPVSYLYEKGKATAQELKAGAEELYRSGASTMGDAVLELSTRVSESADALSSAAGRALAEAGKGAGEAYESFFGVPPWVAVLMGVVVLGGAGYLLLSPGGQSLLMGGGKAAAGAGSALMKL